MVVILAQGGGLFIGGVANLESCNVCSNTATSLVSPSSLNPPRQEPSLNFHPAQLETLYWQGGGLFIAYGGVANLESCNLCSNTATFSVCSPSEPSQTVIPQLFQHRVTEPTRDVPSPAWIVSYSLYRVVASSSSALQI